MAAKDSVLNFVIRAKNMAGDAIAKFRKDVETLDGTSANAGKSVGSLGNAAEALGNDASSASAGTNALNSALDDVSTNASDAAQSLSSADASMDGIASSAKGVGDASASATKSVDQLGDSAKDLGDKTKSAATGTQALSTDMGEIDSKATGASDAMDQLGNEARDLGTNTKTAGAGTKALVEGMDDVDTSANEAALALQKAEKEAADAARELHDSGVAADKAASSVGKMGQRYNAAGKPIETAKQKIKKANVEIKQAETASNKTGTSIANFAKRLVALAAAAVGIRAITGQLKAMLSTGDEFEKLGMQMEQAMGSIEGGKKATEWVTQFAKDTPLQMREVTETFTRLKNFGIDPMNGSMQAIVDQASALGGGFERVEGISLALGQAWAKQKLQGEEILQLIERGVPVWDLLEKATGKNTLELQKLSTAGALGRDVIQQLMDEMGKANSGAAAKNMSLLSGYVSNLKDEWQLFLNEIAKAGALDYVKDRLAGLLRTIQEMKANGDLTQLAQRISDGFVSIAETTKSVVLAIKDNIGAVALLGKAYVALKLAGVASDVGRVALAMKAQLAAGTAAAVTQTKALALALRAIPWLAVVQGVVSVADAYAQLKAAQRELAESQKLQNDVQAEATQRLKEFNEQTGLNVQSLDEIIAAQDAGAVAIDEYTGKWRLATDQLTEAEKAQRAQAEAAKKSAADLAALSGQMQSMLQSFRGAREEGKTLAEAIAGIGESAKAGGQQGIEALSLAIEQLALDGAATHQELSAGLGEYLASLSDEEYTRFGKDIAAEFERIQNSADATSNRLSFMQTLLDANLTAAAKRAGVEIGKVLTGVDTQTSGAISAFTNLVNQLNATSTSAADSDKIIKAGLLETLKSLDTSAEINATIAAIQALGASGALSAQQVADLTDVVQQKGKELQEQNDKNATKQVENNAAIRDSVTQVTEAQKEQTEEIGRAGGMATALAAAYRAIRATVDELGPAASAAFEKLQGIDTGVDQMTGEFAELKKAIQDASAEIDQMRSLSVADFSGISRFIEETGRNAAIVRKEYAEQKLALEELKRQYEDGAISAAQFADRARGAASATSLLGQQDLSYLRNAIRAAEERMEAFRDTTSDTLNNLRSELAQLQGDTARVEELNYQSRIADLEQKLEQAQATGDKEAIQNAQQALQLANEIYQTRIAQIEAEKRAAAERKRELEAEADLEKRRDLERDQAQQKPQPVPPARIEPTPLPSQRIDLRLPNGNTATLSGSTDDVNKLLDFLNEAGMRAIG